MYRFVRIMTILAVMSVVIPAAPVQAEPTVLLVGPGETWTTISSAVASASAGDTIQVTAGAYKEYVVLDKPGLRLVGPNTGVSGTAERAPEAVIMPPDGPAGRGGSGLVNGTLIEVTAPGVTIDGMALTGDNPDNADGDLLAEGGIAEANCGVFIDGTTATADVTVEDCVIEDLAGYGVYLYERSAGHLITRCAIRGIRAATYNGSNHPGLGIYGQMSAYFSATHNAIDSNWGIKIDIFEGMAGAPAEMPQWNSNEITCAVVGINYNPQSWGGAPGRAFEMRGNRIHIGYPKIGLRWQAGMAFWSVYDHLGIPTAPIVADNVLSGGEAGYHVWSVTETMTAGPLRITGGSVTGADDGIRVYNYDTLWGAAAISPRSGAIFEGIRIRGCDNGVSVRDGNDAGAPQPVTVWASIVPTTSVRQCGTGAKAVGPKASISAPTVGMGANGAAVETSAGGTVDTPITMPTIGIDPMPAWAPTQTLTLTSGGVTPTAFYAVESGDEQTYADPVVFIDEGLWNVGARVEDNWGFSAYDSVVFGVDRTAPEIDVDPGISPVFGPDGGIVSADATDALSGVTSFDVSLDDGDTWTALADEGVPLTDMGPASIRLRATDAAGNEAVSDVEALVSADVTRVAGTDRYLTAIAGSRSAFATAGAVVLATGADFADALAAAPLGGLNACPVLLVPQSAAAASLPAITAEINRLGATRLLVVGGVGAVPTAVVEAVRTATGIAAEDVLRYGGITRYETAADIAAAVLDAADGAIPVLVCRGDTFPDALSAGPAAWAARVPIVLVRPDSIPASTTAVLGDPRAGEAIAVGGSGAISPAVFAELAARPEGAVRVYGDNRFATAAAMAGEAMDRGWLAEKAVAIASGEVFADALSAGAPAGARRAPLLLSLTSQLPPASDEWLADHRSTVGRAVLFGGSSRLGDAVFGEVEASLW